MMNIAYKYRIYPNKKQEELFMKTFGCCRKVWNLMLNDKIENYKQTNTFGMFTPAMYKKDYPYLKEVDSLALANVQLNLQSAFRNCFDKNRKTNNNFPKFKSKHKAKERYTTNNQGNTIVLSDGFIKLPKVGKVKIKLHRHPKDNWKLCNATISKEVDKYYVSIVFEYNEDTINKTINKEKLIGLDYSSDALYVDSNNHKCDMPHYFRENQSKLIKAQKRLSRKIGSKKSETKSKNYLKQLNKVNKVHTLIANQRKDFLHKKSRELANTYDVVIVEDIDMKNISQGLRLGKATMDNGYGYFRDLLKYKLERNGGALVKIDKWYPSTKTCSCCGNKVKSIPLGQRVYICDKCNTVIDRDYNAALNIKDEGIRMLSL